LDRTVIVCGGFTSLSLTIGDVTAKLAINGKSIFVIPMTFSSMPKNAKAACQTTQENN
jgi:hypothetical protein